MAEIPGTIIFATVFHRILDLKRGACLCTLFCFKSAGTDSTNGCLRHLTKEAFYQNFQHFFRISVFVTDMRPDYSHKSFGDERASYIYFSHACARYRFISLSICPEGPSIFYLFSSLSFTCYMSPFAMEVTPVVPEEIILSGTDHIELYIGNAKQAAHYYKTAFGFQSLAYAEPETGLKDNV
ncbi:MAG: hypothetical protein BGP13_02850 [Sphingobacteriales bacterium 40-81]|nr:MAG: hypothetical protein BGP13_02850 [Sphingobacteriales bacterium 40-81]